MRKVRLGVMLSIFACGCQTEQMRARDSLLDELAIAREVQMARAGWVREQGALRRIADLRSDDPNGRGVKLEWVGPRWVIGRLPCEAEAYFLRAWAVYLGGTQVTDEDMRLIANLEQLRVLLLHRTEITDAGLIYLKALPHLHTLNLRNTKVTDIGAQQLAGLTNLRTVNLCSTGVTDKGGCAMRRALPNAEIEWR